MSISIKMDQEAMVELQGILHSTEKCTNEETHKNTIDPNKEDTQEYAENNFMNTCHWKIGKN